MADSTDASITAKKLSADEFQIKIEEQPSSQETTTNESTYSLNVYGMNIKPKCILIWLMVIITCINMCLFPSSIISTGAIIFANRTQLPYPPTVNIPL